MDPQELLDMIQLESSTVGSEQLHILGPSVEHQNEQSGQVSLKVAP